MDDTKRKCEICGNEINAFSLNPCYDCTFKDPLFWCYKHKHYSFDRVKCPACLKEIKQENQKGTLIGI